MQQDLELPILRLNSEEQTPVDASLYKSAKESSEETKEPPF